MQAVRMLSPGSHHHTVCPQTHGTAALEKGDTNSRLWGGKLPALQSWVACERVCPSDAQGQLPSCSHACCLLHGPLRGVGAQLVLNKERLN